jgi:GT2 family glycosyltransferase
LIHEASVIIVCYNGLQYLEDCLTSIQADAGMRAEIIMIDNASSDRSTSYIEDHFPMVKLCRNETNKGFALACNQGAALAGSDTLVFLNQDTCVLPGWLDALLDGLDDRSGVGLTTSQVLLMSMPDKVHLCGQDVHYAGFAFGHGFLTARQFEGIEVEVTAVSGASFAIRKELWERLGGFDPLYHMYYEETDLSLRARMLGYRSIVTPGSVVLHDYEPGISSSTLYLTTRNRLILLMKLWRWYSFVLLFPGFFLAELIDLVYAMLLGREGIRAKKKAFAWLLSNIPDIQKTRKETQAHREVGDWLLLRSCSYRLSPSLITGGRVGRIAIKIAEMFWGLNYSIALSLLQLSKC